MSAALEPRRYEINRREMLEVERQRLTAAYIAIHDLGGGMAAVIAPSDAARQELGRRRRDQLTAQGWIV